MRKLGFMLRVALSALLAASTLARGADAPPPPPGAEITPPRLSFLDGTVSFRRPGAEDWAPARLNTPLAEGDGLYTGSAANLEIQIGARAFARAAENTELGIVAIEPDFLQLKVTSGQASLDLRGLGPAQTFELDTPHAVFTIEHPGYYRVAVLEDATHFITRRGGRATLTRADGARKSVVAAEEIVVRDDSVETYAAPELDAWDRWNYARTDYEIEALSARYVSPGTYGAGALDLYGSWRVVSPYGAVWIPEGVPAGWAPYTTGSWIWDVRFGWTWVDDAPWGWAPFHHGRWVLVGGLWAWAPGPVIVRAVYAPALVAFFALSTHVSVSIGIPGPGIGWVALGWGEPLLPWWGRPGFAGAPWWGGWGGPRVTVVVHEHIRTPRAVVAVGERQFGAGPVRVMHLEQTRARELARIAGMPPVRPGVASLVPDSKRAAVRPPAGVASRPVVATRAPREAPERARVVAPPKRPDLSVPAPRPSFGAKGVERPRPAAPPRLEDLRRAPPAARPAPGVAPQAPQQARQPRALPGRPANEEYSRRSQAPAQSKGREARPQR
ncbi:MAG: DUF6600 domain-containing protein [Burkholderiales bacterium]